MARQQISGKMTRLVSLPLLAASLFMLGGCVAGMAVSAVGMAAKSAQGQPASNAHLKPEAEAACTASAQKHGNVHIIDVQQSTPSKIIVWGTVDDGSGRKSFECGYGTRITSFKLRAIRPQS